MTFYQIFLFRFPIIKAIHCDGITCPAGSTTCIVSKKTFGNITSYKYIRLCTNASGKITQFLCYIFRIIKIYSTGAVTHKVEKELPNPNPGMAINSYSLSSGDLTEEERKELDANIKNMAQDTDKIVHETAEKINRETEQWTKDFKEKLEKQFQPGFPFI